MLYKIQMVCLRRKVFYNFRSTLLITALVPPGFAAHPLNKTTVHSPAKEPHAQGTTKDRNPKSTTNIAQTAQKKTPLPLTKPQRIRARKDSPTDVLNLVVVGHVDAGKSTLAGHLLCLLDCIDTRTIGRYKHEASKAGKGSFAYAWVMDEGEEERSRGVTIDVGRVAFSSPASKRRYNVLDAPGHRDFISNMISGAAQADAALLVINSTVGEFETGLEQKGQTREHSLLLRSLGVTRVVVAVNKLDTTGWDPERFKMIQQELKQFLHKQTGFDDVKFVPVSGLQGTNLAKRPESTHPLTAWYNGPSLVEALGMRPINRISNIDYRLISL